MKDIRQCSSRLVDEGPVNERSIRNGSFTWRFAKCWAISRLLDFYEELIILT
ncbi:hypothetical protein NPIL_285081, partial [Nephila pilipes]